MDWLIPLQDPSTPHPLINAVGPPSSSTLTQTSRSSADGSSTTVDSPFPPLPSSSAKNTPSPYASSAIAAMTSTPFSLKSRSRSRSTLTGMSETQNTFRRQERTLSATGRLESSSLRGKERWQTPGEMSRSFSGDEIPVEDELQEESVTEDLGAEESVPLNDLSLVSGVRCLMTHLLTISMTNSRTSRSKQKQQLKPPSLIAYRPVMSSFSDQESDRSLSCHLNRKRIHNQRHRPERPRQRNRQPQHRRLFSFRLKAAFLVCPKASYPGPTQVVRRAPLRGRQGLS